MPWVRLDENFPDHPKVAMLSPAAGWLHVCALCYCNRQLTDGKIPKGVEERLTAVRGKSAQRAVDELLSVGLWIDGGDEWIIHDFHDFQPTRETVLDQREKAADRQRRAREKSAEKRARSHLHSIENGGSQ